MNRHRQTCSITQRQKGVALVVSLILLTVITLLSLTAMRSANLDTKIAVNHQHKQFAFHAGAENALNRLLVADITTVKAPGTLNGAPVTNTNWFQESNVSNNASVSADLTMDMTEISKQYKFSGFPLNVVTFVFTADAYGRVDGANNKVHNRMEVALIRE